jgi:hypothetical protein
MRTSLYGITRVVSAHGRESRASDERRCRAENLCHSLRHGIEDMWVATSTDDVSKLKDDDEFMTSNLRVMQGEATREEDKLTLVLPILGLYAEVFANHLVYEAPEKIDAYQAKDRNLTALASVSQTFRETSLQRLSQTLTWSSSTAAPGAVDTRKARDARHFKAAGVVGMIVRLQPNASSRAVPPRRRNHG